jgi:hypothetical protein
MSKDLGHREDLVSDKLVTHHIFFMIDLDGIGPVDNFLDILIMSMEIS